MNNPVPQENEGESPFEQLHRRHDATIYDLIVRYIQDRDKAEQIAVETWVTTWRQWERLRRESDVLAHVEQIAVRLCRGQ